MWNDVELYADPIFAVSYTNNTEKGTATAIVTVDAEDLKGEMSAEFEIKDVTEVFDDVAADDWYFGDGAYMHRKAYMNGVSDREFSPNTSLTRGMFAAILYRFDGEPRFDGKVGFDDVDDEEYYADAIGWAKRNGIVSGVSDTEFAPDEYITRAETAAMMHRLSK